MSGVDLEFHDEDPPDRLLRKIRGLETYINTILSENCSEPVDVDRGLHYHGNVRADQHGQMVHNGARAVFPSAGIYIDVDETGRPRLTRDVNSLTDNLRFGLRQLPRLAAVVQRVFRRHSSPSLGLDPRSVGDGRPGPAGEAGPGHAESGDA